MEPGLDLGVGNNLNGSEIRLCPAALWSPKSPGRDWLIDFDKNRMGKMSRNPIKNDSTRNGVMAPCFIYVYAYA